MGEWARDEKNNPGYGRLIAGFVLLYRADPEGEVILFVSKQQMGKEKDIC